MVLTRPSRELRIKLGGSDEHSAMPGDRAWLLSRNAVRAACRAEARRAAGRLPWGAKSRLLKAAAAPAPAAQVPRKRLRSKSHLHEPRSAPAGAAEAPTLAAQVPRRRLRSKTHLHEPQSAPAGVAQERAAPLCRAQSAPADVAQERAAPLCEAQSAPAEEAQDTCFAGGDPDDAVLWDSIDKDMAIEREGLLNQRERSAASRERMLESWESELDERAEQIVAQERRLLAEKAALRPKLGGRGGLGDDAVWRLLAR